MIATAFLRTRGAFAGPMLCRRLPVTAARTHLFLRPLSSLTEKKESLKAVYFSRKIDVLAMHQQIKVGRLLEDDFLVVPLPSVAIEDVKTESADQQPAKARRRILAQRTTAEDLTEGEQEQGKHCVFFSHGAVVFFNCDEAVQQEYLAKCKPFAKGVVDELEHENFELDIDPTIQQWSKFAPNKLILQTLDLKNISVISVALAQAVSLRHFEDEIDDLLQEFEKNEMDAIRILRQSSKVLRDVIWTLGLLDHASEGSPAWHDEKYHIVWTGLRDEFEIEKRWRVLQTKTNFLQDHFKFAVELAHARTSERLETAIIALITAELLISIYHLYQ